MPVYFTCTAPPEVTNLAEQNLSQSSNSVNQAVRINQPPTSPRSQSDILKLVSQSTSSKRPLVVATTGFLADITANIAGGTCEVISLLPTGTDPHTYEAIPGDAALLARADMVIENGLTLEGWLDKLIRNTGKQAIRVVATRGIVPIQSYEHSGSVDPHAWMDPVYGRRYARNICSALINLLPEQRQELEDRWLRYDQQLEETDAYIRRILSIVPPEHRFIATTHDAFRYLGNRYGYGVLSLLGTTTDAEVRTGDLQEMVRNIQSRRLPALFVETTLNPRLMQQVAHDGRIRLGGKLYADSMGPKGSGADTYLRMLKYNAQVIAAALAPQAYLSFVRSEPDSNAERETGFDKQRTAYRTSTAHNEDFQNEVYQSGSVVFLMIILACFSAAAFFLILRIQRAAPRIELRNQPLQIDSLSASYAQTTVLQHFSLKLPAGAFYGLVGPNGSGKSTLFKSALGIIKPDNGSVQLAGYPLHHHTTGVAYVPQREDIDLNFPATVQDVVLMGRYPHHKPTERINKKDLQEAEQAMTELDILQLRHRPIGGLSGGQQQRTFLARALCQRPQWYLLDEPFTGVDQSTEDKILQVLRREVESGKSVLMIHHDLTRARSIFDQVILINRRLIAFGRPEDVLTEENILKTYSGLHSLYDEAGVIHHHQQGSL
jgi:ABC-type Mn2+/Zn2+ transport system ATPase subunit/ABC-type Zn uptake system ZnuABC Zn-binding protein ZnuA